MKPIIIIMNDVMSGEENICRSKDGCKWFYGHVSYQAFRNLYTGFLKSNKLRLRGCLWRYMYSMYSQSV